MMPIKVFISYASGNKQNDDFVLNLTNDLRKIYGFEAINDKSVYISDFDEFMITKLNESDKVILVINEEYNKKANSLYGGVGKETKLLFFDRFNNFQKIVPIKIEKCEMPYYLGNANYIDFTKGSYDENVEKLVLRLRNKAPYKLAEITKNPKHVDSKEIGVDDSLIPDFNIVTIEGQNEFMQSEFDKADARIRELLKQTKNKNTGFDYRVKRDFYCTNKISYIDNSDKIEACEYNATVNGKESNIIMWISRFMGVNNKSIFVYFDRLPVGHFNSFNLMVTFDPSTKQLNANTFDCSEIFDGKGLGEYIFKKMGENLK